MEIKNREEIVKDIKKDYLLLLPNGEEIKLELSNADEVLEKLEKYAINDDPYFEHLYHLTIDKIRRF